MSMSPTCSTSRRPDSGLRRKSPSARAWAPRAGGYQTSGITRSGELEKRIGPTAEEGLSLLVRRYRPVGVDAALAGVIFALGPAAITDATSDPSGVPKSAVKEFERYWARRQIEVTAHLDRYGAPPSR